MKNRNSHHKQVVYQRYSTYIEASNQDIRVCKPTQKGINIPKAKTYKVKKNFIKIKKS